MDKKIETKYAALIIAVVALIVFFLFWTTLSKTEKKDQQGLVYDSQGVKIDMTISPALATAKPVEPGIYGAHAAKLLDEVAFTTNWLNQMKTLSGELDPTYMRYPAGGLSKYGHVWTTHMDQPLTAAETAKLVNGNEIRGNGYILQDRIDEEEAGNAGELAEITTPKPKYGGLSYLQGFQNIQPRNFIHDFVEIAKAGNSGALVVANITYGTPQETLQQIDFLNGKGVKVMGVECGNEQYLKANEWFQTGNPQTVAPVSVANYLNRCDEFKAVISVKYPKMEYAVTAAPKKDFDEEGAQSGLTFNDVWNTELNTQMATRGYKNYVMHFYAPFTSCQDEIEGGEQAEIFACGSAELINLRKVQTAEGVLSFPKVLDWYKNNFPGKKMWLTEWNLNQENDVGTGGMLANSILHGAFTQDVLNMMNDANVKHGNFITFANYHTFANQEWNTLVQERAGNGQNEEPADSGDFVRRTPYFAHKTMKDIFLKKLVPLQINTSAHPGELDGLYMHAYEDRANKKVYVAITNISGVSVGFQNATFGAIKLDKVSGIDTYFLQGPTIHSSRGATEYSFFDSANQAREVSAIRQAIGNIRIPPYSVGYMVIDTSPHVRTTIGNWW